MVIEESDFKMTSSTEDDGRFFDLELLKESKARDGTKKSEFKVVGYGLPFESCLKMIISYRVSKKQESFSLKEYVNTYTEEINKLKNIIRYE